MVRLPYIIDLSTQDNFCTQILKGAELEGVQLMKMENC